MAPQGGLGNSQDPGRLSRHRVHPPRGKVRQNSAVLLALAGMELEGGIASVCRAMARALDAEVDAGRLAVVDRVLLHDVPAHAPQPPARGTQWLARGSQPLFAAQLWARWLWRRHELIVFDQVGPARSLRLPLPGLPTPRYAIFCHGGELERSEKEPLASAMCGAWHLLTNSAHTGRDVTRRFPDLESRVRVTPLCIDPRRIATWEPLGLPDASAKREPAVLMHACGSSATATIASVSKPKPAKRGWRIASTFSAASATSNSLACIGVHRSSRCRAAKRASDSSTQRRSGTGSRALARRQMRHRK